MDKAEALTEIQRMHEKKTVQPKSIIAWYYFYSHKLPIMRPERSTVDLVRTAALWMELTDRGGSPGFPYDYRSELRVTHADSPDAGKPNHGFRLGVGLILLGLIALFVKPLVGILLIVAGPVMWYVSYRLGGAAAHPELLLGNECQRVLEWSERQSDLDR
jgi:hypothetical protein